MLQDNFDPLNIGMIVFMLFILNTSDPFVFYSDKVIFSSQVTFTFPLKLS